MRISIFDKCEYDQTELYKQFGEVTYHSRFTYHTAKEADVIFTTFSHTPDIDGFVVNMDRSDFGHLSKINRATIIQAGPWYDHAVAMSAIQRIAAARTGGLVVVVGHGNIGNRVARFCRFAGWDVSHLRHNAPIPTADVVSIHTRSTGPGFLQFDAKLDGQRGAFVVNTARRLLVSDLALERLLRNGSIRGYSVDGGKPHSDDRVEVTPHIAWKGPKTAILRPKRIVEILQQIKAGTIKRQPPRVLGFGL